MRNMVPASEHLALRDNTDGADADASPICLQHKARVEQVPQIHHKLRQAVVVPTSLVLDRVNVGEDFSSFAQVCVCVCVCVCTRFCSLLPSVCAHVGMGGECICMHACMHACIFVCKYVIGWVGGWMCAKLVFVCSLCGFKAKSEADSMKQKQGRQQDE